MKWAFQRYGYLIHRMYGLSTGGLQSLPIFSGQFSCTILFEPE